PATGAWRPMMPVLFLDDGGVMNDNRRRAPQWRRLLGEFFSPRLGGAPDAWAAANRVVVERLYDELWAPRNPVAGDWATRYRAERIAWLAGMCGLVGVAAPDEEACLDLERRVSEYVTRRVRAAFPGAVEAIRALHARGHRLNTASNEISWELAGYLEGMG